MTSSTTTKRVFCLANSRKVGGACVAGKELLKSKEERPSIGNWIRPVSGRETEELSWEERRYADRTDPQVLDVIDIPLSSPQPNNHQKENWLIAQERWSKVGKYNSKVLNNFLDPVSPLWLNGHRSFNGINDRVPSGSVSNLSDSLRLIRVDALILTTHAQGSTQGEFVHYGTTYKLRVTDPNYHRRQLQQKNDLEKLDCFLTISLGEVFRDGYCYKLIAAIIA